MRGEEEVGSRELPNSNLTASVGPVSVWSDSSGQKKAWGMRRKAWVGSCQSPVSSWTSWGMRREEEVGSRQ